MHLFFDGNDHFQMLAFHWNEDTNMSFCLLSFLKKLLRFRPAVFQSGLISMGTSGCKPNIFHVTSYRWLSLVWLRTHLTPSASYLLWDSWCPSPQELCLDTETPKARTNMVEQDWEFSKVVLHSLILLSVLLSLSYEKDIFNNEDEDLSFGRCILVVRQFFNFYYMKETFKNTVLSFPLKKKKEL